MKIGRRIEHAVRSWSPKWRPNRFKATLIGLVAAAIAIPLALLALPYLEIFNDMAVQPKGKTQGLYGWFSDEALVVQRPPVEGTIPMRGIPVHEIEGEGEEAAEAAGETLRNPLRRTRAAIERGRDRYEVFCIVCHGERGEGDGSIVGPSLFPAPPSLHTDAARAFPDGRIYHVITRGQNKMPSYADVLEPDDRWAVVLYVRALQRAMRMEPEGGGR